MNQPVQPANRDRSSIMNIGIYLLGLGTVAAGILDLVWGDFDPGHQPIAALVNPIPGHAIFAYIAALWLILAGAALVWRRTIRVGAWATAGIYFLFGLFPIPRFYTLPHKFGFHITLTLGVFGEMLLQFIMVAACMVLYAPLAPPASFWREKSSLVARCVFGLTGVLIGMGHFVNVKGLVHIIPKWMPFGAPFWIVLTGICFSLAGVAILSGILNILAARLLALMLVIFEIALVPILFGYRHMHVAWGSTAYNLTVAGSVLIYAAFLASRKAQRESDAKTEFAEVS